MNIASIRAIVKHELTRQRVNPATYIVLIIIAALWLFLFFRQAFLLNEASLRLLFDYLPWLLSIVVPALTMGSIAKEKNDQTLELLLTHPVREAELLVGKLVSALTIVVALVATTVPLALAFSWFGQFDWGAYVASLIGTLLLSASLVSLGLMFSTILRDQVAALLVSVVTFFIWMLTGFELITSRLPLTLSQLLANLSPMTHYTSMLRGVLDIRDIWFFLSTSALFFSVSALWLLRQKYGNARIAVRSYQIAVVLLAIIVVLSNILSQRLPGRLDVTQDRLYTLSPATKQVLANLPDAVTITLYASSNVPAQLQTVLRDTKDLLRDYDRLGGDNLSLVIKDPSLNEELQQAALEQGIQEVQFNVISQEEFQVKSGYFGIVLEHAGQTRSLPFVQQTADLEYQLTSYIADLTRTDKPTIAIAAGHGEQSEFGELSSLASLLSRQYQLESVNLTVDEEGNVADALSPDRFQTLLIAAPTASYEPALLDEIDQFVQAGGNVMVVASGLLADAQTLTTLPVEHNLNDLLSRYGLQIDTDLVYDLESNQTIQLAGGGFQYLVPYPFWVKAQAMSDSPVLTKDVLTVLTWPSEIKINQESIEQSGWKIEPLVVTSPNAGVMGDTGSIAPNTELAEDNLDSRVLAVALNPSEDSSKGRVVVVGATDAFVNDLVAAVEGNATLGLSSIGWLTQDDLLARLRIKQGIDRSLQFTAYAQPIMIMVLAYAVAVGGPVLVGVTVFWRRRRRRSQPYIDTGSA